MMSRLTKAFTRALGIGFGGRTKPDTSSTNLLLKLRVNERSVCVPKGSTLLDAAKAAGVHVPTLCYKPGLTANAVCRVCLVEDERTGRCVPACATPATEGASVQTDTTVIEEFRKSDTQLLLARHPNDCMACEVQGSCKLQSLVQEHSLHDKWPKVERGDRESHPEHNLHDHTSPAVHRDMDKCIECGLCVQACGPELQDQNVLGFAERGAAMLPVTPFDVPLGQTGCISCGQCTLVCPVGALTESADWHRVLHILDGRRVKTVVQVAPATRIAIGEEMGMAPGQVSTGRLINALRMLGFDYVFDTNFAADLTIMEEGAELIERVTGKRDAPLPQFTSCCPGWVNWLEINRPDLLAHLSTTKSPQQMHAAVVKRALSIDGSTSEDCSQTEAKQDVVVVSVMPCSAKKDEARRPAQAGDVDIVITTRELGRMLRSRKIPFASLSNDGIFDDPLGESTGAAQIFGMSGGVMVAALRTVSHILGHGGGDIEFDDMLSGIVGVKAATVEGIGTVAVCNGIRSAKRLLEDDDWREKYVAIEVMTCVGGCLGGGGEPKSDDPDILTKRAAAVRSIDKGSVTRFSHENVSVKKLYETVLDHPLSHKSEQLLHTTFSARHSPRELLAQFLSCVDRRDGRGAAALFVGNSGVEPEWDTGGTFGVVRGREAIANVIDSMILANGKGSKLLRHRFHDPAYGTTVLTPDGDLCEFEVILSNGSSSANSKDHVAGNRREINVRELPRIVSLKRRILTA